jgi:hypothetical protein
VSGSPWEGFKRIWLAPLRLLGHLIEIFAANRARLGEIKRRKRVAVLLKFGALATLVAWLLLALTADDGQDRLNEAVRQLWPGASKEVQDASGTDQAGRDAPPPGTPER